MKRSSSTPRNGKQPPLLINYGEPTGSPFLHGDTMKIEITRTGIYDQSGQPLSVGTQLDVPDDFSKWANKYRVIASGAGKTLEPATPERTAEEQEWLDAPAVGREFGSGQDEAEQITGKPRPVKRRGRPRKSKEAE